MKKERLISVIMPVYNEEKFVGQAIESILNQTFSDFEFLILDDGSTDKSKDIIRQYEKKDSRIKIITSKNEGLVSTLNKGIKLARSKIIARMDADDISYKTRLEKQFTLINQNPELFLVGTNFKIKIEKGVSPDTIRIKQRFEKNVNEPISVDNYCIDIYNGYKILHATWMIRKQLFEKIGLYRELCAEDVEFLFRTVNNGFAVSKVDEILYEYRITKNSKSVIESEELKTKKQIISFKLDFILKKLDKSAKNLDYFIWGGDQSGLICYNILSERYPNIKCLGIVDSLKTGDLEGIPIIKKEECGDLKNKFCFICTNGGKKDALSYMNLYGKQVIKDYFIVV